jgi:uracil-DNA glycosylase
MPPKQQQLNELKKEMEADSSLPLANEANFVFGEGNAEAAICFIGEAPGFHEDRQGRPFVGLAGQLLDKLLLEIHWPRESVYITNIVKRRPPQNRDPLPGELAAYAPYLQKQIEILQPKIIATLGRFSMNYFLPLAKISRDHGRLLKTKTHIIYPLDHPAAALRSTNIKDELAADFKRLPEALLRMEHMPELAEQKNMEEKPQTSLF